MASRFYVEFETRDMMTLAYAKFFGDQRARTIVPIGALWNNYRVESS